MVINMSFPSYKEIEIPLLLNIYNGGGEVSSSSCYEPLGKEFGLTNEEMNMLLPDDTNRPQWNNMVQWARKKLVDYKYLAVAARNPHGTDNQQSGENRSIQFLHGADSLLFVRSVASAVASSSAQLSQTLLGYPLLQFLL